MEDADEFSRLHNATIRSLIYREAAAESLPGLPIWLIPFSIIDGTVLERFAGALRVGSGDSLVDVGCGTGGPGVWVAKKTGARLTGIDISSAAIREAAKLAADVDPNGGARFLCADILDAGIEDESIDGIMSVDVLMFLDPDGAVKAISRMLKPGGVFVATAAESIVEPFMPTLVRDYRPYFEANGFDLIVHEEHVGQMARQMAFYRALEQRSEALTAEIGEPSEALLEEARNGLTRFREGTIRVRPTFIVAKKI